MEKCKLMIIFDYSLSQHIKLVHMLR